jgi:putative membrane protein
MPMIRPLAAVVLSSALLACATKSEAPKSETAADVVNTAPPPPPLVAEPAPPAEPAPVAAAPAETAPPPPALNDAQVVKVLEATDLGEIEEAKVAQKKAKNPKVKKFAAHMIQQHTKAKQKGAMLAKKAKLTPEESPVSGQVTGKSVAQLDALKAAEPADFDALYIHGQLLAHEEVLSLLQNQLIPAASDEGLKSHLAETQKMVETHIADARAIQAELVAANPGSAPNVLGSAGGASTSGGAESMDAGR